MDRQLLWLNVGLVAYILPFLSCLFHSVVVTYLLYHNKRTKNKFSFSVEECTDVWYNKEEDYFRQKEL